MGNSVISILLSSSSAISPFTTYLRYKIQRVREREEEIRHWDKRQDKVLIFLPGRLDLFNLSRKVLEPGFHGQRLLKVQHPAQVVDDVRRFVVGDVCGPSCSDSGRSVDQDHGDDGYIV